MDDKLIKILACNIRFAGADSDHYFISATVVVDGLS